MKKFLFMTLLSFSFLLCGWLDFEPECNSEDVLRTLKEVLKDEWAYVEYGLTEQSLGAVVLSFNGMDLKTAGKTLEAAKSADTSGFLREALNPISALRDYANESAHTSFEGFVTLNSYKKTFCKATLKIEYPVMPEDMKKNYNRGILKGVLFDGGEAKKQINYSVQYSDDNKYIYVELLPYPIF